MQYFVYEGYITEQMHAYADWYLHNKSEGVIKNFVLYDNHILHEMHMPWELFTQWNTGAVTTISFLDHFSGVEASHLNI